MDTTSQFAAALSSRYVIERKLGEGGMANVYLARDLNHDRPVAIKILKRELASALGAQRFLSEIRVTSKLSHPNILQLLDSGDAGGVLYYVMPFVDGESLRARMDRERQLRVDEALEIARQIAEGLKHAHARGIIHRDIKPENILLEQGRAMIADFGVARAIKSAGNARITETGVAVGTPTYMSPEQATAERELDGRSDLYSLASVTYEMLLGVPPFTGPNAQAVIARRLTDDPRSICATRFTVPPAVDAVILKALARAPRDRYSSVARFAEALRYATTGVEPPRWTRRPMALAVSVAVGVAVLGALGMLVAREVAGR